MNFIQELREKSKKYTYSQLTAKLLEKISEKTIFSIRNIFAKIYHIKVNQDIFDDFITGMSFLFNAEDSKKYVEYLEQTGKSESIIIQADKICRHVFDLLGSGETYLGEKIDWSMDFKSGFKWPEKHYRLIKIIDHSNDADVKVPLELSRFQHLFTLGKAYWLTNDSKYVHEFKSQIEDWIDENPVEMSVNWVYAMDVAIRAVNWITAFFFFRTSSELNKSFWNKFNTCLYLHGKFIINNLECNYKHTTNHYLSNVIGLVWLGVYFKGFYQIELLQGGFAHRWLRFGCAELEKEMFVQINDDGTDYETSTAYHRLVTEMILITSILCSSNNISFSKGFYNRLEKMCEFIMDITKPNGLAPVIGDADDGRFIIISEYPGWIRNDFRHLLSIAGEYFNRDDFRFYGKEHSEDAMWVCGCHNTVMEYQGRGGPAAYEAGGIYILKNHRVRMIIRCGPLSCRGQGGHSHNDQLSFELNVDGEDIIIDPGVFTYSADYKLRNLFRSTSMHNTVQIDGYEQNDFSKYELFTMTEQSFGICTKFSDCLFIGEHYGYRDKCGIVHERTVKLDENGVEIIDRFMGDKLGKTFKANLILTNEIGFVMDRENRNCKLETKGYEIGLELHNAGQITEGKVFIADRYGIMKETNRLEIISQEDIHLRIRI